MSVMNEYSDEELGAVFAYLQSLPAIHNQVPGCGSACGRRTFRPRVPTRGDFDFPELSRRLPMSGGYIRNSALRAAFLAAQEAVPLSQEHLLRAIQLEYRELGKLSTGGRRE